MCHMMQRGSVCTRICRVVRFRVQGLGLGFRVQGLGSDFRVLGLGSGFRVQDLVLRVQALGVRVQASGFRVQGLGFRCQGVGQVLGYRLQVFGGSVPITIQKKKQIQEKKLNGDRAQALGLRRQCPHQNLRCTQVQGLGFRVQGLGCQGLGSRSWGAVSAPESGCTFLFYFFILFFTWALARARPTMS